MEQPLCLLTWGFGYHLFARQWISLSGDYRGRAVHLELRDFETGFVFPFLISHLYPSSRLCLLYFHFDLRTIPGGAWELLSVLG